MASLIGLHEAYVKQGETSDPIRCPECGTDYPTTYEDHNGEQQPNRVKRTAIYMYGHCISCRHKENIKAAIDMLTNEGIDMLHYYMEREFHLCRLLEKDDAIEIGLHKYDKRRQQ